MKTKDEILKPLEIVDQDVGLHGRKLKIGSEIGAYAEHCREVALIEVLIDIRDTLDSIDESINWGS